MHLQKKGIKILILILISFAAENSFAQDCVPDYFYLKYRGEYQQQIKQTIITPQSDLLSIGSVYYSKNGIFFEDGLITKMTAQGTVLWSKRYSIPWHNVISFKDIIPATDSTYFVVGNMSYLWPIDTTFYSRDILGIILYIDKQGKLLWCKKLSTDFDARITDTYFRDISKTKNGDFILGGVIRNSNALQSAPIIFRISSTGDVKWMSIASFTNFEFDFGLIKSLQLKNGNILIAGMIYDRSGYGIPKVGYYFLNLDYQTGANLWSNGYLFINSPSSTYFATSESLQHIEEHPDGNLSFVAYTSEPGSVSNPPNTSKSVNIILNASGQLQKAVSYTNSQAGTYPVAALDAGNGEKLILVDDGANSLLIGINSAGNILWKNGYNSGAAIRPASLNFAASGYYIFLNDRGPRGGNSYLMKVDSFASIDCKTSIAQLTDIDVTSLFVPENVGINLSTSNINLLSSFSAVSYEYPLSANTECIKACCADVADTVVKTTLCEGNIYTLPDGYKVKEAGTYYNSYKTSKGCDSVAFYKFFFLKNPDSLKIEGDACLEGKDSIIIKATSGFENYNWVNHITTDSNYVVTKPGIYWVGVSNSCGSKTHSIEIYNECEFPIYIPSAFTPNGDGLNDVFRIPPANKNKLIRLQIFNRWGQKVFETTDKTKGWDGTLNKKFQPTGVYAYLLIMESLNGKKIAEHGTVTLIR